MRLAGFVAAVLVAGSSVARADDGLGLRRGGDSNGVTISGVSSGAAMAVQYAVAHSQSIIGVGAIAGPAWGCADGRISRAVNVCMCGGQAPESKVDVARELAASGRIDSLSSGKPRALRRAYVFHSAADATVVAQSGIAGIAFLAAFVGAEPVVDWGNAADGSAQAGHGIVSPDGMDSCAADGRETSYVRRCGARDNAGKLLSALYPDVPFDASRRVNDVPETELWKFDQKQVIDRVKAGGSTVSWDDWSWFYPWLYSTPRRENFDMAATGYVYVPPSCRQAGRSCRVHVALHGCKQDVREFAMRAGYNNWAEHFGVIVVYPAVEPSVPTGEGCATSVSAVADYAWIEPNPNGCWDWWGYLDSSGQKTRYLTKGAPQMQVIEQIIAAVTAPLAAPR
jgi:poly(3-hydroxybutyrate) depolymerase